MIGNIITGFFSGIISGMGIGGGAILIPALTLLQNISQQMSQGINLVYFIPTAIISLFVHIKNKRVEIKTAIIIGISGLVGAVGGSMMMVRLSEGLLGKLFGGFLFFIGCYEIYKGIKIKKE